MSLGKLKVHGAFEHITHILLENSIELLPVTFDHIQTLLRLENHHRDPFDRIIIAQGIFEDLVIATKDENFELYPVPVLWK